MYYQYDRASVSHEHRGFLGILWGRCEEFAASYHSGLSRRLPGGCPRRLPRTTQKVPEVFDPGFPDPGFPALALHAGMTALQDHAEGARGL